MARLEPGDTDQCEARESRRVMGLGLSALRPTSLRDRLERLRLKQEQLVQELLSMEKDAAALERLLE